MSTDGDDAFFQVNPTHYQAGDQHRFIWHQLDESLQKRLYLLQEMDHHAVLSKIICAGMTPRKAADWHQLIRPYTRNEAETMEYFGF